jgi:nitrogen fixation protein FixH
MRIHLNWGVGITIVYTLFALGTVGVVAFAMTQPVDLVSDDYYERSLTYDQQIAAIENGDALGPAVVVAIEPGTRSLRIGLPVADASRAHGEISLYRPSTLGADRTFGLALDASGTQRVPLAGLAPGLWRARLRWTEGSRTFYREQIVTVP